ncbi:MAG: MmgE/PrpD family protein [Cyanobacteria bacterium P01_H01_bin.74]
MALLADRLAKYTTSLSYDSISQPALHEAKKRLIDSLGCAMGAVSTGSVPAKIAVDIAKMASAPTGGATVLTTRHQSTPDLVAFVLGTMIRYLDFNDTYLSKEPAHPSDNIAAILAVAEANQNNGKDILTAIVLAYEIQCRLCDAASIRAKGWDHVTYGAFSAGLAAGKLYGLTEQQLVHLQGLAATPNNALRQTRVGELSHWKGCAFANASRNAVFAAMLANQGMSGPSEIFEGEMGFWAQVSGPFELPLLAQETSQAPDSFMINQTYVKHFPAEYHSQSAIEAALSLREAIGPENIDTKIKQITIESFDAAVDIIAGFEEHWHPKTRETADHSMPFCVAAALMDGEITLKTFTPERITDPQLVNLIQKVKVNRNAEMTAGYPKGIPNLITVETTDGQTHQKQVTYPLGHAGNPMSDQDVEMKFRAQVRDVLPDTDMVRILDMIWQLETCTDIGELLRLFANPLCVNS